MEKFLVKLSGTDRWFQVESASQSKLADYYKKLGIAATIKCVNDPQTTQKEGVMKKLSENAKIVLAYWEENDPESYAHIIDDLSFLLDEQYVNQQMKLIEKHKKEVVMKTKTKAPVAALVKKELLNPETREYLVNLLDREIAPLLEKDVSAYAPGRMRAWMPYEAPLDTPANMNKPFVPGILHAELWQFIVDLCAKHGLKAQTALVSKGGMIAPHRDTTYAAAWAMGINLGACDWYIAPERQGTFSFDNNGNVKGDAYHMSLSGGEVFAFNTKHVHAVRNAAPDRWSINVWAIADTHAARNADVQGRLDAMLAANPQVAEFVNNHKVTNTKDQKEVKVENNKMMKEYFITKRNEDGTSYDVSVVANSAIEAAEMFKISGISGTLREASDSPKPQLTKEVTMETAPTPTTPVSATAQALVLNNNPKGGNMIKEYIVSREVFINNQKEVVYGRVITNDPWYWIHRKNDFIIEEIDRGGYHYALAEKLFGDKSFCVTVTSFFNPYDFMKTVQVVPSLYGNKPDEVVFGYADFDAETLIYVKGYNSTEYADMGQYGLVVKNSSKMTKRLTELVKAVSGYAIHENNDRKLRIKVLTHADLLRAFPHLEEEERAGKCMDGVSLMAEETVKYVYRNNPHMSKSAKSRILRGIENKTITNHTVRILTNINGEGGLIKGNALHAPRGVLMARLRELGLVGEKEVFDVVTSVDNFKNEFGTDGSFEFISLEAHHGPGIVKTNDQMLAQYKGVPGVFKFNELLDTFQVALDKMYNDLVEGKDLGILDSITADRAENEADRINILTSKKRTGAVNQIAAALNDLDLGIGVSQTMMLNRANLVKKMFLSDTAKPGENWKASAREKKAFVFQPWAYTAYIMTKEVVYMLGYDVDFNDQEGLYHAETQTFMIPGTIVLETMSILGGGDFDDSVMVHVRKMVMKDGSIRLVALLIRTPNDWAEYRIIDITEFGPVYFGEEDGIDLPTIYEKDFDKFKVTSVAGELPSAVNGSTRPNSPVWDWKTTKYNANTAMYVGTGVGGQVKAKMLQYGINNRPFAELPCKNEDMIDAIQQVKADVNDLKCLGAWGDQVMADILTGKPMDAYWWSSRNMYGTSRALIKAGTIDSATKPIYFTKSPIVTEFMVPREKMVRETFDKMLEFLNQNIQEIPELANIFASKKEELQYRKVVKEFHDMFLSKMVEGADGNLRKMDKDEYGRHLDATAKNILERTLRNQAKWDEERFNLSLLKLVRASWLLKQDAINLNWAKAKNYDRWLYSAPKDADKLMSDFFFQAMIWFRNKNKNN